MKRVGYSDHGIRRAAQRWRVYDACPPSASAWDRAFEVPKRFARQMEIRVKRGNRIMATKDAIAVIARNTVVTIFRAGEDVVDDLRATAPCRAMGLDVGIEL